MFKSYRKLKITTLSSVLLASALALTACDAKEPTDHVKEAADALVQKAKVAETTTKETIAAVTEKTTAAVKDIASSAGEKVAAAAAVATTSTAAAATASEKMGGSGTYENGKYVIDGGVYYPVKDGKEGPYYANTQEKKGFTYGRTPSKAEIDAWDIDVMPDGTGLPEGKGSVEEGDEIYEEKCAACHKDFGTGGDGYPAMGKGNAYEGQKTLVHQRLNPDDDGPVRNFGSYWPQASTLWWYVKTGMPHPAPLSLSDDEVYAVCAYILSINEITIDGEELDDEYVLDREKFLKIEMPNKDGFEPVIDGPQGVENARAYFHDTKNYGNGTRCMTGCFEGDAKVQEIAHPIEDLHPALSKVKDLPKEDASKVVPGKKDYETSCAVCHSNGVAPAPGAPEWKKIMEQGLDTVVSNAINGKGGMPPRGGTTLDDAKIKEIVEYLTK